MDTQELLRPALTGYRRTEDRYRPWRLQSQIYVAFFGGALAVGAIAVANAFMLGMPRRKQLAIAGVALLAEAALVVVIALTGTGPLRLGGVAAGLAAYGPLYLLQRSPDRVHHFHAREDDPYDSLFGPGLVAVIVARLVESFLLTAISGS